MVTSISVVTHIVVVEVVGCLAEGGGTAVAFYSWESRRHWVQSADFVLDVLKAGAGECRSRVVDVLSNSFPWSRVPPDLEYFVQAWIRGWSSFFMQC